MSKKTFLIRKGARYFAAVMVIICMVALTGAGFVVMGDEADDNSQPSTAQVAMFENDTEYSFTGTLEYRIGLDARNDEHQYVALVLDEPITYQSDEASVNTVDAIQLSPVDESVSTQLKENIGNIVDLKGTVVSGTQSPYYYTDILIHVNEISSGDYFSYNILEDGTAEIVGFDFDCSEAIIVIPEVLDGYVVSSIGDNAFNYRPNLTEITIPDSVTEIGRNPFTKCYNLTSISVSPNHPTLAVIDDVLFSKPDKRLVWCPENKEGRYEVPKGIEIIGKDAFWGCDGLTDVTLPDSVTLIDHCAFGGCFGLTKVTIPDSVTTIGEGVFSACNNLTNVTLPDSLTEISGCVFNGCVNLTKITIPDNVTSIGVQAFYMCHSLTLLNIPDNVTSISPNAFDLCYNLTLIVTPNSYAEEFCIENNLKYQYE